MSTQHVCNFDSVQVAFLTLTKHLYQNCSALKSWLPLIFRIRQVLQTSDLSYFLPSHRATVYIMGIALGFVLRYCGRDFRLKKVCVRFEVICVVTVNIAVSCVVTAYGPIFFVDICFFQLYGRTLSHTVTKQPLLACCFPLVFFTNIVPNHLLFIITFCFAYF
jgi:hypothetical protein